MEQKVIGGEHKKCTEKVIEFVKTHKSQSHLCICNTHLFNDTVKNGVYGFPHQGSNQMKSFWRAVSSMYNIGPNDLIFLYRTKGDVEGCQEINGPFKIFVDNSHPALYYDRDSSDFTLKIDGITDCKVRFLFESFDERISSIYDNFELIKKFEKKEIWGYRHPAVMNIGAARKKSVTSFTYKQTLAILDLLINCGSIRQIIPRTIPVKQRITYYQSISSSKSSKHFLLDDTFLLNANTNDEAFLYAYILRGLKYPGSFLHEDTVSDFSAINNKMLLSGCAKSFSDFTVNAMMEVIISPHLQDELDIVLFDENDSNMVFMEMKEGQIDQSAVLQVQTYLDLLEAIFPSKRIFADVIGSGKDPKVKIDKKFMDKLRLVKYTKQASTGKLSFVSV
jgi:hypothetical protein